MLKLAPRGVPRCHLVHFVGLYYRIENPAWKLSCRDVLCAQSAFSPFFVRVRLSVPDEPARTRWPTGCVLFFSRRFLLFVLVRNKDWRGYLFENSATMLGQNLFSFPSISFLSLYLLLFVSIWFSIRSFVRFERFDGSTSGVPPIILRTKHKWNCRNSWSWPIAWPCSSEPHLTCLPVRGIIDSYFQLFYWKRMSYCILYQDRL